MRAQLLRIALVALLEASSMMAQECGNELAAASAAIHAATASFAGDESLESWEKSLSYFTAAFEAALRFSNPQLRTLPLMLVQSRGDYAVPAVERVLEAVSQVLAKGPA